MNNFIVTMFVFFVSISNAEAARSKMTKVDIDVDTTHVIKADIGRDDLYYYIDDTACICWVSQSMGSSFAVSTFDCTKLIKHPKLKPHVEDCLEHKPEPVVEVKTEENKVEEPKPSGTKNDAELTNKDKK